MGLQPGALPFPRKGQGRGGGRGGGGRRPSVQRPRQRALVGSRLEGCGQTSARTGPPPVIAPFSPASTRQPGNQEQGGRQVVGQGALESDGSEGALERFLALVPVSPGLPYWGSHPPLPHGPPAEEESWSRVTGAPTPCYDGQPGLGPSLFGSRRSSASGSRCSPGLAGLPSQRRLSHSSRVLTLSGPSSF